MSLSVADSGSAGVPLTTACEVFVSPVTASMGSPWLLFPVLSGAAVSSHLPLCPGVQSPGSPPRCQTPYFLFGITEYFKSALRQSREDFVASSFNYLAESQSTKRMSLLPKGSSLESRTLQFSVRSPGLRLLIHLRRSSGPVATLSFLLRAILIGLGRCLASIAFSLAPSLIWNP